MRRADSKISWDLEPWAVVATPYDEDFIGALKARVHIRAFDPGSKTWIVPARYVPIVRDLAKKHLGIDIAVTLPPNLAPHVARATPAPRIPEEYEILCVLPGSPIEVIKASYKALAFMCHPDRGGNAEHFRQLTAAYEKVCGK
jgi:hypothetical protein